MVDEIEQCIASKLSSIRDALERHLADPVRRMSVEMKANHLRILDWPNQMNESQITDELMRGAIKKWASCNRRRPCAYVELGEIAPPMLGLLDLLMGNDVCRLVDFLEVNEDRRDVERDLIRLLNRSRPQLPNRIISVDLM